MATKRKTKPRPIPPGKTRPRPIPPGKYTVELAAKPIGAAGEWFIATLRIKTGPRRGVLKAWMKK